MFIQDKKEKQKQLVQKMVKNNFWMLKPLTNFNSNYKV